MTTTAIIDDVEGALRDKPGAQLAMARVAKGLSAEYVAGKLHLRVRIIELLETDDYLSMPEPVFIKGYIRAYAKLLEVPSEPLLDLFNQQGVSERRLEKALWQGKRETHRGERLIRLFTAMLAFVVVGAVVMWWQNNKENEHLLPTQMSRSAETSTQSDTEIRLTDLSKMRSLLSSNPAEHSQALDTESQDG